MVLDVYIDIIFFVNFFMDFLLLMLLRGILKRPVSCKRLGAAAALGGLSGCLELFLGSWGVALLLPGTGIAMAAAAFGWRGIRELIKEAAALFGLAVVAGGAMELLYRHTRAGFYFLKLILGEWGYAMPLLAWGLAAAGVFFLIRGLWQFDRELRRERKNLCPLILTDGKVQAEAAGYLDTGNCLMEPGSGQGVHIVTERIWKVFQGSRGERAKIPYRTVGNPYGIMEGLRIEKMEIKQPGSNIKIDAPWIAKAPFGISKRGAYEVLLYGETTIREDKEGGITSGH